MKAYILYIFVQNIGGMGWYNIPTKEDCEEIKLSVQRTMWAFGYPRAIGVCLTSIYIKPSE